MATDVETRTLQLGEDLALPVDAVTRTVAVVGQKGTGKTSSAVVMVEEAAAAGARFGWIDPTGAGSGLRSSADGEGPGLDCVVMGGFNGDVPLDPGAGEVVARLIVEEGYSVVCDLERMPRSQQILFVAEFAEAAYYLCRSAVTLVFDEAPRFVPQGGGGGSKQETEDLARCRRAVTEVVMLGRRKGLGSVLISQRPAKLHKDVLEQADVLIAHRLMGNNDRQAIAGWLEEYGEEGGDWLSRLPKLARGEAVVLAPEYELGGVFQIRMKRTFDSSATPDVGAVLLDAPRGRADIDLSALEQKMGHALEQAQENDPEALRRKVKRLEAQLAEGGGASADELAAALARVTELEREVERRDVYGALLSIGHDAQKIADYAKTLRNIFRPDDGAARSAPSDMEGVQSTAAPERPTTQAPADVGDDRTAVDGGRGRSPGGESDPSYARAATGNGSGVELQGPPIKAGAKRMLAALVDVPRPVTRAELGTLADVRGGTFSDYLSALRAHGFVAEADGRVALNAAKAATVQQLVGRGPQTRAPHDVAAPHVAKAKAGARRMLDMVMRAHPEGFTRTELSRVAEVRGGTFSDYLSFLRRRGLVEERAKRIYAGSVLYLWQDAR